MNILRWTIGDVTKAGLEVLNLSIVKTKKSLHRFNFKFFVCSNANDDFEIKKICLKQNVIFFKSLWDTFPLPEDTLEDKIQNPKGRLGSFWKLCPPRLELNSYEIVLDNDVIIQKSPLEIEKFLNSDQVLIKEENVVNLGKYYNFSNIGYNSGLYGFPPNYNFKEKIHEYWLETGALKPLFSKDEQGLIVMTLKKQSHIIIPNSKILYLLHDGIAKNITYEKKIEHGYLSQHLDIKKYEFPSSFKSEIIHFLGINRTSNHQFWQLYKQMKML